MDYAQGRERIGVRKYNKSEFPRLRWTPRLHELFVDAVRSLGGKDKATPKRIMQIMSVKGLKISHIKSHLQMYRSMEDRDQIDIFVRTRHLSKKAQYLHEIHNLKDRSRVFSPLSSQRQVGNELRHEWKDFDINEIYSHGGNGLGQTEEETSDNKALQETSRFKVNEKIGLNEFSGLSLYSTPPIMANEEEEEKEVENWQHGSHRTSSRSVSHSNNSTCTLSSSDLQDVVANHMINLDLTI